MPAVALPKKHPPTRGQLSLTLPGVRLRAVPDPKPGPMKRRSERREQPPAPAATAPRPVRAARPAITGRSRRLPVANLAPPPLPEGVSLPRHWGIQFEALDGADRGKVRVTVPGARGDARVFRPNPDTIWGAFLWARHKTAEAGVAAWSGRRTVMDSLTEADDPTEEKRRPVAAATDLAARKGRKISYGADRAVRPDQADVSLWSPNPPEKDGTLTWRSPGGQRHRKLPAGVAKGRLALGLPMSWDEHVAMGGGAEVAL